MKSLRHTVFLLGLALLPSALAGQTADTTKPAKPAKIQKEKDRISREELQLAAEKFPDLYDAIRSLRSHFLAAPRGARQTIVDGGRGSRQAAGDIGMPITAASPGASLGNTLPGPVVYIDGMKRGDTDQLKSIRTENIEEVRYMTPNQAGNEFGLGQEGGAILVKTIPPPKPKPES